MSLKGFSLPLSPKGTASLVSSPPWYYVGTGLVVEYWTTPKAIEEVLPEGVDPNPQSGPRVKAQFVEWQNASKDGQEYLDPCRSQYSEFMLWVDASYQGKPVSYCPYIYVTSDMSMARGWIQGLPKKLASIHITRAYPFSSPATPVVGEGGQFGASVAVNDRRLAECRVRLQKPETDLTGVMNASTINMRYFPRLSIGHYQEPVVHELIMKGSISNVAKLSDFWVGEGSLTLLPVPGEEADALVPIRFGRGWRGHYSLCLDQQITVHDYTKK